VDGSQEKVPVRLSQVEQSLRLQAADIITKKCGLTTFAALELSMAAAEPLQDPVLYVSPEKARIVLEEGKFPTGPFPGFEV
jgi:hypothetical protein